MLYAGKLTLFKYLDKVQEINLEDLIILRKRATTFADWQSSLKNLTVIKNYNKILKMKNKEKNFCFIHFDVIWVMIFLFI